MNLKFESIIIDNFLSFEHAELNLDNNDFVLVSGKNLNISDNSASNGSGKSAIFDAISWCLTGETIRGAKSVSNIYTDDGACVELHFYVDKDKYVVIRTKDNKEYGTNLKIFINDVDKSGKGIRDGSDLLNQYLPDLNEDIIGSVIILGQGLPQRFSSNNPSKRKEALEKLIKSDYIVADIKERISRRLDELSISDKNINNTLVDKSATIREKSNLLATTKNKLTSLADKEESKHQIEKLKTNLARVEEEYKVTADLLNSNTDESNELRCKQIDLLNRQSEKINEVEDKYKNIIDKEKDKKSKVESEIYHLKNEIAKINNIQNICPTCGRKFEGIVKPSTKPFEDDLNTKLEEKKSIESIIINIENDKCAEIRSIKKSNEDSIKSIELKIKENKEEYNKLSNNASKLLSESQNNKITIARLESELAANDSLKKECEDNIDKLSHEIESLTEEINVYNSKAADIKERIDIVKKFESIAKKEFRSYLLSNVIIYLNKKAREYSSKIFNTNNIKISIESNNVNIYYCDKMYENLSGGEKQRIDVIIQLAIRDMLCEFMNFNCNILVIDEVFDNLDKISCQAMIGVLSNIDNISSIFIITHHEDLSIPYDKELVVVKNENGISYIQ